MTPERLPEQPNQLNLSEAPGNTDEYRLLDNPDEILKTWGEEIDLAESGEKVWLRTMHCRNGRAMDVLEPKLIAAAQRGADVRMLYDTISYLESNGLPSYARHFPIPQRAALKEEYERNRALHERLRAGGVQMELTRPETTARQIFPYKGADHIKGTRIRDRFWFGDKNLEDISFGRMKGFVIEIPDPAIIEKLTQIIGSTESPNQDEPTEINPETTIIWDAGIPYQSTIYETALGIVNRANEFVGTSTQFYPEGKYYKALKDAKADGLTVQSVTSSPDFFGWSPYAAVNDLSGKLIRWDGLVPEETYEDESDSNSVEKTGVLKFLLKQRKLLLEAFRREASSGFRRSTDSTGDFKMAFVDDGVHAKYVVTDNEVYFGTNNLSEWGIRAGTAELGIRSSNPQLVSLVRDYHNRLFQATLEDMSRRKAEAKE